MGQKKSIARSVKATAKNIIASNTVFGNLYFAFFKEKISISVKDKTISYYMNPLFGKTLKAIDRNGEYEGPFLSRMIDDMIDFQKEANVCYLDIGGSFGFDILVLDAFLEDNNTYITFEPDKFCRIFLRKNVANIPVKIVDKFVSDRSSQNSVSIDDFCEANGIEPTHIKIDIEGGEISALKGMIKTLEKHKPKIYIEMHEIFIRNRLGMEQREIENFFNTLTELGYEMEYNSHHYPLFSGSSDVYDYSWFAEKPNSELYAVVCQ